MADHQTYCDDCFSAVPAPISGRARAAADTAQLARIFDALDLADIRRGLTLIDAAIVLKAIRDDDAETLLRHFEAAVDGASSARGVV